MKIFSIGAIIFITTVPLGCTHSSPPRNAAAQLDAPALMTQYGCPTCHVIPQVPGAVGKVGPSLDDLAQRAYIAGILQNSPSNLVHWIQHPQQIHPGTAMPEMGVTSTDAARIAAFLETHQ